jgi:serine protease AprX
LKRLPILLLFLLAVSCTHAQDKYWVSFTDKSGKTFDPYKYFVGRTIDQRCMQNLPLDDSTDFPLNENYVSAVKSTVSEVLSSSRWLNGIAVHATSREIEKVKMLPFVSGVEMLNHIASLAGKKEKQSHKLSRDEIALLHYQTNRMQGEKFKAGKLDGSGIRIALLDAGFPGVDHHPAFEHLRRNKKIIATYDFVGKKEFVYSHNSHGTMTLSCITGIMDSTNSGLATGAEFLLARTEKEFGEPYSEEENWLAAAEWADKNGANIISSSLGYTNSRYFNTDLDGKKSLVARAASIAAKKGILVINAAGNDGDDAWHFIDTPGDADSVLYVV